MMLWVFVPISLPVDHGLGAVVPWQECYVGQNEY